MGRRREHDIIQSGSMACPPRHQMQSGGMACSQGTRLDNVTLGFEGPALWYWKQLHFAAASISWAPWFCGQDIARLEHDQLHRNLVAPGACAAG